MKKKTNIVLASSSKRRIQLLNQIGIIPEKIIPHEYSESFSVNRKKLNEFKKVSLYKALSIRKKGIFKNKYILAADTIIFRAGKIYHKTDKLDLIKSYLKELSGKKHFVYGGICVISPKNEIVNRLIITEVFFKRISKNELNNIDLIKDGVNKSGGYAIQSLGQLLIKKIKGSYSNVVGLSLFDLNNILYGLGWRKNK